MSVKRESNLKLVPWESWHVWDEVREAVFSSSPAAVSAALDRIAAWRSRNTMPVSIEITADIINIQRTDPHFSGHSASDSYIGGEMLQLMYAMAIMRLVNGVVDHSKKQNSLSVADRAKAASLPRMLVDIRHEVAHKELPSLPYLRLASKKALEWLKSNYWEAQKIALVDARDQLKTKLYAYAASLSPEIENSSPGLKSTKDTEKDMIKSASIAVPEVVSILADDGLLEQCMMKDGIWRITIGKLCSCIPQLLREIMSWCTKNNKGILGTELISNLLDQAQNRRRTYDASKLSKLNNLVKKLNCDNQAEELEPSQAIDSELINNDSLLQDAAKRLLSLQRLHSTPSVSDVNRCQKSSSKGKWTVAQNWKTCAIGMLPSPHNPVGALPFSSMLLPSDTVEERPAVYVDAETQTVETDNLVHNHVVGNSKIGQEQNMVKGTEQYAATESGETASVVKHFEPVNTIIEQIGGKRVMAEKETEPTNTVKRSKLNAETKETSNEEDTHQSKIARGTDMNRCTYHVRLHPKLSGAYLLFNGVYQQCSIDALATIQSSIQVFK